jgi:hypothetical protein
MFNPELVGTAPMAGIWFLVTLALVFAWCKAGYTALAVAPLAPFRGLGALGWMISTALLGLDPLTRYLWIYGRADLVLTTLGLMTIGTLGMAAWDWATAYNEVYRQRYQSKVEARTMNVIEGRRYANAVRDLGAHGGGKALGTRPVWVDITSVQDIRRPAPRAIAPARRALTERVRRAVGR